ncbi:MAG TPA: endonuclease III [Phycisphaerales bacterium]|nr:endonuclease III [Phycisphaerales bacterium]
MSPGVPQTAAAQKAEFGFTLPRPTAAQRARAARLLTELRTHYPGARCELSYTSPHELLVATILSAQATDASVNRATPALFKAFPAPADFARATPQQIEPYIKSIGLYRNKAKAIHAAMTEVAGRFGGDVPQTMAELLTLRGVARKTAGVVLGNAFNINMNVVVDTHVHRLSQRLALAPRGASVQQTERWLMALFPRDSWCELSHLLIFHGRYTCKARGVKCCEHPVCCEFGQRCELRITAGPAKPPIPKPRAGKQKKRPRKESNL